MTLAKVLALGALLAAAGPSRAAQLSTDSLPLRSLAEKPFGVLLLGEGGDDNWRTTVAQVRKDLARKFPVEFAPGLADRKAMQKAVDALQAQRVKAVVAVPLFISSFSDIMDQNRYLLGIRDKPPKELAQAPHSHMGYGTAKRVATKLPVVLTKALDDHPIMVDILASRALKLGRNPEGEAVVLIGEAPESKEGGQEWLDQASALAEKVRQKGGFAGGQAAALHSGLSQQGREKAEKQARELVRAMTREGARVIVVPLALSSGLGRSRIPEALDGLFFRFDGKTVLPDSRISKWVEESAVEGGKLPDMRVFKDEGNRPRPFSSGPAPLKTQGDYQ